MTRIEMYMTAGYTLSLSLGTFPDQRGLTLMLLWVYAAFITWNNSQMLFWFILLFTPNLMNPSHKLTLYRTYICSFRNTSFNIFALLKWISWQYILHFWVKWCWCYNVFFPLFKVEVKDSQPKTKKERWCAGILCQSTKTVCTIIYQNSFGNSFFCFYVKHK